MNGAALTYAAVAVHQAELRAAAERSRRRPGRRPRKRILAKLGVGTRGETSAVAHRLGMDAGAT